MKQDRKERRTEMEILKDTLSAREAEYRRSALGAVFPAIMVIGVVVFSFIRPLFLPKEDPLDKGLDKRQRVIASVNVIDTAYNGFSLSYASRKPITPARYDEMIVRPHIVECIHNLKRDAPIHFGNLLHTDIYDFASFAARYHPDPDVELHNIIAFGSQKMDQYIGPNPKIVNPARWIDHGTRQGVLYISGKDFSCYLSGSPKVYRYINCPVPHNRSDNEEYFSHFSENDRLH